MGGPCAYFADRPDGAVGNPFADVAYVFTCVSLIAHLSRHLRSAGGFGELAGFINRISQRFFNVHVFAGPDGRHCDARVRVVRSGDDNGFDVLLLVEHPAVIFVDFRLGIGLEGLCGIRVMDVAQCDDVLTSAILHV